MTEMLRIVNFEARHLEGFIAGESAAVALAVAGDPALLAALETDRAFSGFWGPRLIGCAAVYGIWPGRAAAWALFADPRSGGVPLRAWPAITRRVTAELERAHDDGYRRIETSVRSDFAHGINWAVTLGFEPASLEPFYGPDGASHVMFRRIRLRGAAP